MSALAFLSYDKTRWKLEVAGSETAFDSLAEGLVAARRLLAHDGGMIYVGSGPGAEGGDLHRVEPQPGLAPGIEPSVAPALLERAPPPPVIERKPPPPPASAVAPTPDPGPEPTADAASEISELRVAYQRARAQIEAFDDEVERDIGLGTLRLEANHTLTSLRSTGAGLTEADLEPLSAYVTTLGGGGTSVRAVETFEKAAAKVLRDVFNSLIFVTLKGSVFLIAGLITLYFGKAAELGAGVAGFLAAGGGAVVYFAFRFAAQAAATAGKVAEGSWDYAERVGDTAERAMAEPRRLEQQLWKRCAGPAPWRHRSLARRAKIAAMAIVGVSFVCIAIGVLGFAGGFIGFFEQLGNSPTTTSP